MTDRDSLLAYRMKEAEETLADAEQMLQNGLSPRSTTNRAYYAMFYNSGGNVFQTLLTI